MPEVVARCPVYRCRKPIFTDHRCAWCTECGTPLPRDIQLKLPELRDVADRSWVEGIETAETAEVQAEGWPATLGAGERSVLFGILGAICGAFVGYLMRPAAPFLGQLNFETVISRGTNLQGLDQLLVSTAQASFNGMLMAAVLAGLIGAVVGYVVSLNKSPMPAPPATSTREGLDFQPALSQSPCDVGSPKRVEQGNSPDQVVAVMGQPEKIVNFGSEGDPCLQGHEDYLYRRQGVGRAIAIVKLSAMPTLSPGP